MFSALAPPLAEGLQIASPRAEWRCQRTHAMGRRQRLVHPPVSAIVGQSLGASTLVRGPTLGPPILSLRLRLATLRPRREGAARLSSLGTQCCSSARKRTSGANAALRPYLCEGGLNRTTDAQSLNQLAEMHRHITYDVALIALKARLTHRRARSSPRGCLAHW